MTKERQMTAARRFVCLLALMAGLVLVYPSSPHAPNPAQAFTAPTLVDYQQSNWTDISGSSEVTPAITWQAGDRILVLGLTADNTMTFGVPTATGLPFSELGSTNTGNQTKGYAWGATAGSGGSSAVTATAAAGGSGARGIAALVYRGSDGFGTVVADSTLDGTTTDILIL